MMLDTSTLPAAARADKRESGGWMGRQYLVRSPTGDVLGTSASEEEAI